MTPTAMLKATASQRRTPKLPSPLPPQPGPLDTPAFQQEFERIVEESLQPETEPPPPTDIPKTSLPPGLQEELERIIEDNTAYKQSPTKRPQELYPKVLVKKSSSITTTADVAVAWVYDLVDVRPVEAL